MIETMTCFLEKYEFTLLLRLARSHALIKLYST
jgi:hypothetical protein